MKLYYLLLIFFAEALFASDLTCPPMDEGGNRSVTPEAIEMLNQCIESYPNTKDLYFNQETQQYSKARETLHQSIIQGLHNQATCLAYDEQPIAILTAGLPGAGKTTYLRKHFPKLLESHVLVIDADEIRKNLPEYQGWNATNTVSEVKDIIDMVVDDIDKSCPYHIIYDGSLSSLSFIDNFIRRLEDLNYSVYIIYIDIPVDVAIERAVYRYQNSEIGRFVPFNVIEARKDSIEKNVRTLVPLVDGVQIIDGLTEEKRETLGTLLPDYLQTDSEH